MLPAKLVSFQQRTTGFRLETTMYLYRKSGQIVTLWSRVTWFPAVKAAFCYNFHNKHAITVVHNVSNCVADLFFAFFAVWQTS